MTAGFHTEKLRRDHPVDGFACGQEALDRFLIRFAFASQQANAAQTYLGMHGDEVIGFFSLVVGEVAYGDAPERLTKDLARHPVPLMLLARLAVATAWQGRGIGAGLLKDAMRRTFQAAEIGGIRAFAVHAKDASARRFYEHFGFVTSPTDALHLYLLVKDIRRKAGGLALPEGTTRPSLKSYLLTEGVAEADEDEFDRAMRKMRGEGR